jgi:DNA-binding NarL/FixJ family response regulator
MSEPNKQLLAVIELGGYPDFTPLYQQAGYQVTMETKMRKVLKYLKQHQPDVIVAEFNFQSDFRDRTSSIESMMSMVERMSGTKVIIFYDKEYAEQLARLEARFEFAATLPFPIDETALANRVSSV